MKENDCVAAAAAAAADVGETKKKQKTNKRRTTTPRRRFDGWHLTPSSIPRSGKGDAVFPSRRRCHVDDYSPIFRSVFSYWRLPRIDFADWPRLFLSTPPPLAENQTARPHSARRYPIERTENVVVGVGHLLLLPPPPPPPPHLLRPLFGRPVASSRAAHHRRPVMAAPDTPIRRAVFSLAKYRSIIGRSGRNESMRPADRKPEAPPSHCRNFCSPPFLFFFFFFFCSLIGCRPDSALRCTHRPLFSLLFESPFRRWLVPSSFQFHLQRVAARFFFLSFFLFSFHFRTRRWLHLG